MDHLIPATERPRLELPQEVFYYRHPTRPELWARFQSGARVRVGQSRARSYPGLVSEAFATIPLYERFQAALTGAHTVLDIGCGAGFGTRLLSRVCSVVYGVDNDAESLEFAAQSAPNARFVKATLPELESIDAADAAVLCDVLGHLETPFETLHAVRRRLPEGGKIIVAEPAAYSTQTLRAPARRAMSRPSLRAMLGAVGCEVETWLCAEGTFVACVAVVTGDEAHAALARGMKLATLGRADAALVAYTEAGRSSLSAVAVEASLCEAELQMGLGNGDAACAALFKAHQLDAEDTRPLAGLSQLAFATGDAREALLLADRARTLDPTHLSAACAFACALQAESPRDSLQAWRVTSNLAPDHAPVAMRLADLAIACERPGLALRALERPLSYGDIPEAPYHVLRARALVAAGRPTDARLALELALTYDAGDIEAKVLLRNLRD